MGIKIVSNNELVRDKFDSVEFISGNYLDVLISTRNLIHKGWRLVSHPLPASIRMLYSSVRSIVLEEHEELDEDSILIIEESIDKYNLTLENHSIDFRNKKDYELVDLNLLESALNEYKVFCNSQN